MTGYVERKSYLSESPIALVIGCGDLGMACARLLGQRSPLVIVDIDNERLNDSISILQNEGYTASGVCCDITDVAQVGSLAHFVADGPGVKVLAHVAAVGNTPGGWRAVMNVDLIGAHLVMDAIGPHLVRGSVAILISSTGSYQCPVDPRIEVLLDNPLEERFFDQFVEICGGEPDFLRAYFMAKQGINRLARKRAIAWGEREVRVLSVSPGLINSTMGREGGALLPVYDGSGGEQRLGTRAEKAAKEVPLGRQGSLLEVAAVIDFLASDAASFVSGIDIPVDGGGTAAWRERGVIER